MKRAKSIFLVCFSLLAIHPTVNANQTTLNSTTEFLPSAQTLQVCPANFKTSEENTTDNKSILVIDRSKFISNEMSQTTQSTNDENKTLKDSLKQIRKELHRQKVAKRNLHYNILAGPSYTPDFGLLIGGSALFTFRMNPADTTMQRSIVPVSIAFMINGGVNVMVKPQLFFKDDRFRIFGQFSLKNSQENYYGVGYTTNKHYERGETTSEYKYLGVRINPWFLFKMGDSDLFLGPQIDINYDKMKDPASQILKDPSYIAAGGNQNGYKNFSSGLGFLVTYDTRDIPANPYRGVYLDLRGMMYQKWLGGDNNYYQFELDYRQFKSVGKRKVLAWTAQTKHVFGNYIPLNKYILTGTPFDLRGYYMGQYRDKSSHLAMLEYRQMFNTDRSNWFKKIAHHLGYVVWGGVGFMGPNPAKVEGVLPNAGVGLRIEVQPRMNVRLDIGRNFVNKESLFYFNITEAF